MSSGLRNWLIAAICIGVLLAVLIPAILWARIEAWRTESRNNLRNLGIALLNYTDTYEVFPPGATINESNKPLHGWQAILLPFIESSPYYSMIDFDRAWDDPRNVRIFKMRMPFFLNPAISETRTRQGFGLSHYAELRSIRHRKITPPKSSSEPKPSRR